MLYEFITLNREEIIRRCRAKVATRPVPSSTEAEIDHGVPLFLDQLADTLRLRLSSSSPEMSSSAALHGHDLLRQGFTASQVVHDYGDVCQSITELALETDAPISLEDFRMLNRCLDNAIADAITQYGLERNQSTIDGDAVRENERLGFFTLEATALLKRDDATGGIPVIALTALTMKGDEARIRAAGCDGYMSKPMGIQELLATIAAQLVGM
jgi:hypothetical protein